MWWYLIEGLDPRRTTPWVSIALVGLAGLAAVDQWRSMEAPCCALARGVLPNMLAMPVLTFAIVSLAFTDRVPYSVERRHKQRQRFRMALAIAVVALIAWEFAQRSDDLMFDPLDLVATAAGALLSIALFALFERLSFRPPPQGVDGAD